MIYAVRTLPPFYYNLPQLPYLRFFFFFHDAPIFKKDQFLIHPFPFSPTYSLSQISVLMSMARSFPLPEPPFLCQFYENFILVSDGTFLIVHSLYRVPVVFGHGLNPMALSPLPVCNEYVCFSLCPILFSARNEDAL